MSCSRKGCTVESVRWPVMNCHHPKASAPARVAPDLPHCSVHQIATECKADLKDLARRFMRDAGLAQPTVIDFEWTERWVVAPSAGVA